MKEKFVYAKDIEVTKTMKEAFEIYWYHHGDMDDHDIYESQEWVTFRCAWHMSTTNQEKFEKLYKSALNEAKQQYIWRQEDSECGSNEINEGLFMLERRVVNQATEEKQ